jgi:phage terminase large subunit-like protein
VLVCYLLFVDQEGGKKIFSVAGKEEQAGLLFNIVKGMIRNKTALASRVEIKDSQKTIYLANDQNSFFKTIPSNAPKEHGHNASAFVIDEIHVQKNRELFDAMDTSQAARKQPIQILATTADFNRPSFCNEQLEYAKNVRDLKIKDPSYLPVIYELDKAGRDNWTKESSWKKVNPNYGQGIYPHYFHRKCRKAINDREYKNTFKRLHLNIQTDQLNLWIPMSEWDSCDQKFDIEDLFGLTCYGGVDVAAYLDIAAYVLFFPEYYCLLTYFFLASDQVEKHEKYRGWAEEGYIELIPGTTIDQRRIIDQIIFSNSRYDIVDIGFDPWEAVHLATILQEEHGITMVKFPQNYGNMNIPCKKFSSMITDKKIRHNSNPVLRWMVSNAVTKENDNLQIQPSKRDSKGKIDGVTSSIIAIGRWLAHVGDESVAYNEREPTVI